MDGFCGALTTVSTFVAELNGLRRMHAWMYGAASVVGGLAVMLVVMESVR
jgi:CrcB protein